MHWFPLALICAFSLASADAFTKRFYADARGLDLLVVRFGVPALLLLPLTLLYPLPTVPAVFWGWMAILVPLELLAMWLYVTAIRDAPLHLTLPYLAFTPVFNVVTGWIVLGETVTATGFGGIVLVVGGTYLLNLQHRAQGGGWYAPFAAIVRERGSRLMLAVAVIYSLTSVMGKAAMQFVGPLSFGPFYFALIGLLVLGGMAVYRPASLGVLVRRPGPLLVVGLCMALMVVTHFFALAAVEVAYMIAVKRSSLLFGMIYGALWFGERGLPLHLVAGVLMVAGVALIAA